MKAKRLAYTDTRAHVETVTTVRAGRFTSAADMFRAVADECERYNVSVEEAHNAGFLTWIRVLEAGAPHGERDVLDFEMRFQRREECY